MLHGRNIIAAYNPDASERILITSHWDSRPWCDADPDSTLHRNTPVMAANDGASGVAVIIELARLLKELKPAVGIDFVCFDLEDCGAPYWGTGDDEGRDWCLGSRHWAEQASTAGYRARYGICSTWWAAATRDSALRASPHNMPNLSCTAFGTRHHASAQETCS